VVNTILHQLLRCTSITTVPLLPVDSPPRDTRVETGLKDATTGFSRHAYVGKHIYTHARVRASIHPQRQLQCIKEERYSYKSPREHTPSGRRLASKAFKLCSTTTTTTTTTTTVPTTAFRVRCAIRSTEDKGSKVNEKSIDEIDNLCRRLITEPEVATAISPKINWDRPSLIAVDI